MPSAVPSRRLMPLCLCAGCFLASLALFPWIGAERLDPAAALSYLAGERGPHALIFFEQRIPRVLLALAVGGTLSLCGAALQVLFRNPLAEPWTLGVSGGAAVGAFLAQALPALHLALGPLHGGQLLALLGAAGVLGLVWSFARRAGAITTQTLLLAGVTISVISGGLILLLMLFLSPLEFVSYQRWMMGGLDVVGYREVVALLVLATPGVIALLAQARAFNHVALGEELALGHGVDVLRAQRWTFAGAGLATAACVAVAGPIGFVGMIVPHIVRRLGLLDHRLLLPACFCLGGAALAACDTAARTLLAPTEIPVGVLTAVLGGPAFLLLLARR